MERRDQERRSLEERKVRGEGRETEFLKKDNRRDRVL
jgi:hypothetical protein